MSIIPHGTWQGVVAGGHAGHGGGPHHPPSGAGLTFRTARLGLCWRPGPPRGGAAGPPASGCSPHPSSASGSTFGRCRRTPRPASPWCSAAPGSPGCLLWREPRCVPSVPRLAEVPSHQPALPIGMPRERDWHERGPRSVRSCHVNPWGGFLPWVSPAAPCSGRSHPGDPSREHPSPHRTGHPPSHRHGYFQHQSGSLALLSLEKPHRRTAGEADGANPAHSHPCVVVGAADAQCNQPPTQRPKLRTPHPIPAQLLPGTPRQAAFWPGNGCRERWAPPSPHRCRLSQEGFGHGGGTRHWGDLQDPSPPAKALGSVPDGSRRAPSAAGLRFPGEVADFICNRLGTEEKKFPSRPARLGLRSNPAWLFAWRSTIPGTAVPIPVEQGAPVPPGTATRGDDTAQRRVGG